MTINASKVKNTKTANGPRKYPDMEVGTYPARLVQVIDFGLQPQREYKGNAKHPAYEIGVTYEFPDELLLDEEGKEDPTKPRWQSETLVLYSLKVEKAKSTGRYLALDPNNEHNGDWSKILGNAAMVTITQDPNPKNPERPYINIGSVAAMNAKQAAKVGALVNEPRFFDLDDPDLEVFNGFPDWIKDKIKSNLEFAGSKLERLLKGNYKSPQDKDPSLASETDKEDEIVW